MNAEYFFERARRAVFGGRLTARQVDGMNQILAYRDSKYPKMPDAELSYVLATVVHETAFEMQPISERGGQKYLRSKPYFPFYGRGLVQITWERNYKLFGISPPEKALEWPTALDVAFRGMVLGMFTGKKLSDYIGQGKCDYVAARRIINGTDRARLIAGYARAFQDALKQANQTPKATNQTVASK
jgi:putative chitinase